MIEFKESSEAVKAWAEGKQIQFLRDGEWIDIPPLFAKKNHIDHFWNDGRSCSIYDQHLWLPTEEYRLKPSQSKDYVAYGIAKITRRGPEVSELCRVRGEIDNIKLTFSAETGLVIAAEVLLQKDNTAKNNSDKVSQA